MPESSTHQAVLAIGRVEGECNALLRIGTRRFGPPSQFQRERLEAMLDIEALGELLDRVLDAIDWDDLLGRWA